MSVSSGVREGRQGLTDFQLVSAPQLFRSGDRLCSTVLRAISPSPSLLLCCVTVVLARLLPNPGYTECWSVCTAVCRCILMSTYVRASTRVSECASGQASECSGAGTMHIRYVVVSAMLALAFLGRQSEACDWTQQVTMELASKVSKGNRQHCPAGPQAPSPVHKQRGQPEKLRAA